jgi:hypothetical protein
MSDVGLIGCTIISIDFQCITSEPKGNKGKKMGAAGRILRDKRMSWG